MAWTMNPADGHAAPRRRAAPVPCDGAGAAGRSRRSLQRRKRPRAGHGDRAAGRQRSGRRPGCGRARRRSRHYLAGNTGAVALTAATAVFFVSGEAYLRAWSHGAPPDPVSEPAGRRFVRRRRAAAGARLREPRAVDAGGDRRPDACRRKVRQCRPLAGDPRLADVLAGLLPLGGAGEPGAGHGRGADLVPGGGHAPRCGHAAGGAADAADARWPARRSGRGPTSCSSAAVRGRQATESRTGSRRPATGVPAAAARGGAQRRPLHAGADRGVVRPGIKATPSRAFGEKLASGRLGPGAEARGGTGYAGIAGAGVPRPRPPAGVSPRCLRDRGEHSPDPRLSRCSSRPRWPRRVSCGACR